MIIDDYKYVIQNSRHIRINYTKINKMIEKIDFADQSVPVDIRMLKLSVDERLVWILLTESINFCFWPEENWLIEYAGIQYSGSAAMFAYFSKAVDEKIISLDPNKLTKISFNKFCKIFDGDNKPNGMLAERYKNFIEIIEVICNNRKNIFYDIKNQKTDIDLLNYIIKTFKSFEDYSIYKGRKLTFNKRAILVVRDIFEYLPHNQIALKDISNLSACADYVLPALFRDMGVLIYDEYLSKIVDNGFEILHNSEEEIEIRAATILIVEKLKKKLCSVEINIDSVKIDEKLWRYAKNCQFLSKRHHSKTTCY